MQHIQTPTFLWHAAGLNKNRFVISFCSGIVLAILFKCNILFPLNKLSDYTKLFYSDDLFQHSVKVKHSLTTNRDDIQK